MFLTKNVKRLFFYLLVCLILEVVLSRYSPRFNISLAYVLSFYAIVGLGLSVLFGKRNGFYLGMIFVFFIHVANYVKFSNTKEPIGYFDLTSFENYSIIINYIEGWHSFIFLVILVALVIFRKVIFNDFKAIFDFKVIAVFFIALLFTAPFMESSLGKNLMPFYERMQFNSWRWDRNVKKNGLINHIYQTSRVQLPPHNTSGNVDDPVFRVGKNILGNVYMVMCEACWDEDNVAGFSKKLINKEFVELSLISPIYGGGTVNAAFEMLTGMASKSDLNGIIYQAYADSLKENINAYPNIFKELGYVTFNLHNNRRTFWRRHIVSPKFGFDDFYGIESMRSSDGGYPRDNVLFEKALEIIDKNKSKNKFLFLTTIHAHGSYKEEDGDLGFNDYKRRVNLSIDDFLEFFDKVKKDDPDATFLLFADHKPGLNKFFEKNGYIKDFQDWRAVGKVPAFIYSNKIKKDEVKDLNESTMYCFSYKFSRKMMGMLNSAMKYLEDSNLCSNSETMKVNEVRYPSEFYYQFLLK